MPHLHSTSAGIYGRVGGRFEDASKMGISHFVEHMLFKGSQHYSAKQISQLIEGNGGYLNAYTAEEHSCFYFKTLKKSLFSSLDVLVDMYTTPQFNKEEFEKEREVILEEIHSYEDNPAQAIDDLFASVIWEGHPLAHYILGEPHHIEKMTVKHLEEYFEAYYTAPNTVLSVAGPIDHDEVMQWIKENEHRFRLGHENHCTPFLWEQNKPRTKKVDKDLEQCHLQLGFPTAGRDSSDEYTLHVLNTIAGENMSSRLFQELRERRGLAYHVSSSVDFYEEVGCFSMQSSLDPEKVQECIDETLVVLESLHTLDPLELERAKGFIIGHTLQESENSLSAMLWIGEQAIDRREDLSFDGFSSKIQEVKQEEVEHLARRLFDPNNLTLAIIGPSHNDIED